MNQDFKLCHVDRSGEKNIEEEMGLDIEVTKESPFLEEIGM